MDYFNRAKPTGLARYPPHSSFVLCYHCRLCHWSTIRLPASLTLVISLVCPHLFHSHSSNLPFIFIIPRRAGSSSITLLTCSISVLLVLSFSTFEHLASLLLVLYDDVILRYNLIILHRPPPYSRSSQPPPFWSASVTRFQKFDSW